MQHEFPKVNLMFGGLVCPAWVSDFYLWCMPEYSISKIIWICYLRI